MAKSWLRHYSSKDEIMITVAKKTLTPTTLHKLRHGLHEMTHISSTRYDHIKNVCAGKEKNFVDFFNIHQIQSFKHEASKRMRRMKNKNKPYIEVNRVYTTYRCVYTTFSCVRYKLNSCLNCMHFITYFIFISYVAGGCNIT